MIGTTTIVTATYNKAEFFKDAIESVLNQTRKDWRWWIILDGANSDTVDLCLKLQHREPRVTLFNERVKHNERYKFYRPSMLMNKYFPLIMTNYFCWLSDDDILLSTYLEDLAGALDAHCDWDVVYGAAQVLEQTQTGWRPTLTFPEHFDTVYDHKNLPCGHIDGGSILHTKSAYNGVKLSGWEFPTDGTHRYADGLYMNELAKNHTIHPVKKLVMTHRITTLSENTAAKL